MDTPAPPEHMARLLTGYWHTQMLYVAAKLGLPDLLVTGPRTADDLAQATHTHAPSLYRLLRGLACLGVFAEDPSARFANTALSECLRSDSPTSQRALALMCGEQQYQAWGELLFSVQTGKIAFDKVFGMPIFDWLSKNVEQAKTFDAAMVGVHGRETAAMISAYDFSKIGVLADIGGGNGSLLTAVLKAHPSLRGILYDLPGVSERAKANFQAAGVGDRCTVIGGSFFESIPAGADAYLLRHIIHDWDDEKSTTILRNIHRAIGPDGRLLIVEGVVPPGNDFSFTKLLDITMLTIPGGKERTESEYRTLFAGAGFELTSITPTKAEVSVIEGRKR